MADTEPVVPSTVGEVVEEVSFLVGDEPLVARALGRSGRSGSSPLLLIGFWRDGEAGEGSEAGGAGDGPASPRDRRGETEHVREALVVAKDLADIGEDALRVAWREGRKPPAPPGAPPHRREQRRRR